MPYQLLRFAFNKQYPENHMFRRPDQIKTHYDAIRIGAGGHGPLFSLATLKEYGEFYKHQQLIYLITPDNDYSDLQSEIKNIILLIII